MTKDELIDLYLLAKAMHAQAAYNRRQFILNENFEFAMRNQFEMHFWRDESDEIEDELLKQSWYGDAIMEISLC
jgi:hypothetical protein